MSAHAEDATKNILESRSDSSAHALICEKLSSDIFVATNPLAALALSRNSANAALYVKGHM
jgi:hypothetical protein